MQTIFLYNPNTIIIPKNFFWRGVLMFQGFCFEVHYLLKAYIIVQGGGPPDDIYS